EVEAEQRRLFRRALEQPGEHLLARPDMSGANQPRRRIASSFGDRDALVAFAFGTRPVDRDIACEALHLRLRGLGGGSVATKSRDRPITSRTRSSSGLS